MDPTKQEQEKTIPNPIIYHNINLRELDELIALKHEEDTKRIQKIKDAHHNLLFNQNSFQMKHVTDE
jgi:hypothetical protein